MVRQRVFNLTDQPTSLLKRQGLVSLPLRVGEKTIPPGGSELVMLTPRVLAEFAGLRAMGAVCIGSTPGWYSQAHQMSESTKPANSSPPVTVDPAQPVIPPPPRVPIVHAEEHAVLPPEPPPEDFFEDEEQGAEDEEVETEEGVDTGSSPSSSPHLRRKRRRRR
jgi:hypothetical protein